MAGIASIRWQLFVAVAGLTSVVQVVSGWCATRAQEQAEYADLAAHAQAVADELAVTLRDPLYNLDTDLTAVLIEVKIKADLTLDGVVVRDGGGDERLLAARVRGRGGTPASGTFDGMTPWREIPKLVKRDGETLATMRLAFNDRLVRERLDLAIQGRLFSLVLTEAALLVGLAVLLHWLVVRPLRRTADFAAQVRDGHLDQRLGLRSRNELGTLAVALDEMAASLQRSRQELESKRAAAEAAARAKSDFLSMMSHELRTPLNGVIGMSELLMTTPHTPEQRECIDVIQQCGGSLLTLIDDILDYAKIEAGRLDVERIPVDLRRLLEEVAAMIATRAHGKGLELAAACDGAVPGRVVADPLRVRQILANLGSNAVKFTAKGDVTLRATVSGGRLLLSVSDTGIGIAADAQARLFQAFTQADSTMTRRFGGTGLGLAISRRLAHLMGGDIRLESALGRGSTFTLDLPLVAAPGEPAARPFAGRRILLWGGTRGVAETHRAQLAALGAQVLPEGDEPLDSAAARCDLALLDLAQDRLEAFDLVSRLRTVRGANLPVVLLVRPGERAGLPPGLPVMVVGKPIRAAALEAAVAEALEGSASHIGNDTPTALASLAVPGSPRVLVVEDDPINRLVASRLLTALGCRVLVAEDGLQALRHATQSDVALVLMDLQMPVMDGVESIRRWREAEAAVGQRRVPIVVLTADVLSERRADALGAGAEEILAKPIEPQALAQVLRHHVRIG